MNNNHEFWTEITLSNWGDEERRGLGRAKEIEEVLDWRNNIKTRDKYGMAWGGGVEIEDSG